MSPSPRIAALYDIHGNLPALEAVLQELRTAHVDRVVIGGDVFPGPMCRDVLRVLRTLDLPTSFIRGNGDREVLAAAAGGELTSVPERYRPGMRWVADQLRDDERQFASMWPMTWEVSTATHGRVLFCHATPTSDTEIFTIRTPEASLLPAFDAAGADVVICGHTHMPFDRRVGATRVLNAGSVGMPFGAPGAYWLLIGSTIELKRTDYDYAAAADRIRASGHPDADEFALRHVLQPPSEAVMLDALSPASSGRQV